jgi:hypothetical protein
MGGMTDRTDILISDSSSTGLYNQVGGVGEMTIATAEVSAPITPASPQPNLRDAADDLYDVFREARLNVKYYGEWLAFYQRWNLYIQVALAVGTSSTLLSLPLFSYAWIGPILTGTLTVVTAVLGVTNPILNIPKKIERASKLWSGYMAAFISAQTVVRNVKLHKAITATDEQAMQEIHDTMDALCEDDDPCPKKEDINRLTIAVNEEYPEDEFWWPSRSANA